jgi:alpha-D-xyloside xylohydrolase
MQDAEITFPVNDHNYHLTINPNSASLALFNADQSTKVWKLNSVRFRTQDGNWSQVSHSKILTHDAKTALISLFHGDQAVYNLTLTFQKKSLCLKLEPLSDRFEWVSVDFEAAKDENFIGFGERFDTINQRGKQVTLWVEDGAIAGLTYIPIPFYISSHGYGVHIDTNAKCIAHMATADVPNVVSIRNSEPSLSLTLFAGKTAKEILNQYTEIAGRPKVPPKWVFGPWKSRDWQTADQSGILEDIEKQQELKLPSSVKLIDARWEAAYHTFRFDPHKFPDPKAMIDAVHAKGNKVVIWITPWMAVKNENDPEDDYYLCAEKGYFLKDIHGVNYVHQLGMNPMLVGSCIDFTNPQAVEWWQNQIHYLMDLGVDGFNTDFGEQVPENVFFHNGKSGKEMHNIYPVLYNEATFQAMEKHSKPAVLLARSGWHGSQRHSAIWAGDQSSDFSLTSGLHTALIAGQTAAICGFHFWTCDIGGYFGNPTDEVYMRWAQMGAFSPIMLVHGAGKREPWFFSEQVLQNYRKFAKIHTDLFPYIYSYAKHASETGIPILRAMALEFPEDEEVWNELCENQFCFGSELLVAPVHYGFSRTRPVYLPKGTWRDFWTGEKVCGGVEIPCRAEIDHIPVFAKAGSIIPLLDPSAQVIKKPADSEIPYAGDDIKVDIYPGDDGRFRLYDGTLFTWVETEQKLIVSNSPIQRSIAVRLMDGGSRSGFAVSISNHSQETSVASISGEADYTRAVVTSAKTIFQVEN